MEKLHHQLSDEIRGGYKVGLLIICILLTIMIGYCYFHTGSEYAFTVFYLIPISLVTWFIGGIAGLFIAILSIVTWLTGDMIGERFYSSGFIPVVNESFRLIVFLLAIYALTTIKNYLKREKISAREDPLTGIANRRALFELGYRDINRANRDNKPISLALFDIDDFKKINDSYGHRIGDAVLLKVASTLKENVRSTDIVARIGGDEFVIFMADANCSLALEIVNRLLSCLSFVLRLYGWHVTCSVGVVTYTSGVNRLEDMMDRADTLMYSAKNRGKNTVLHEVIESTNK